MHLAVFLDIDGVLNTRTTCERSPEGYHGIDDARVDILSKVLKKYGNADIVLSSDWKVLEQRQNNEDFLYLLSKLEKYGLRLSGKTERDYSDRGLGIKKYVESHPEIEDYVILDDNKFDFADDRECWERLLLTDGIERARFASETPSVETIIFLEYIKEFS